jgi:hypothetical protein
MTYPWASGEVLTAADLNDAMAPAWTAVSFSSPWANYPGSFQTAKYRIVGNRVEVVGLVQPTSSTSANSVIFNLPTGFRPASIQWCGVAGFPSGALVTTIVRVETSGNVIAESAHGAALPLSVNLWFSTGS